MPTISMFYGIIVRMLYLHTQQQSAVYPLRMPRDEGWAQNFILNARKEGMRI